MVKKVYIKCLDRSKVESVKLLGYELLKEALFLEYGIKRDFIELKYGITGKPYFNDIEMFFNLSHSGEYLACVLDNQEIGIDIQVINSIKESIMKRFLYGNEMTPLLQTIRWTEYESFGKKVGCGIPMSNDEYKKGYFLYSLDLEGYVITVCTDNKTYNSLSIECI